MARLLGASSCVLLLACASPEGRSSSSGDPCAEARAHRDESFFVLDLDAGDAAYDGQEDVVVLGADASPPCEGPCMQEAEARRLAHPVFNSCTESAISIGCTVITDQPLPCDLVTP
jgi:hypothetical protein